MLSSAVLVLTMSMAVGQTDTLPSNYEHLKAYDALIGTWTVKGRWFEDSLGVPTKDKPFEARIAFRWILDKNVVECEWSLKLEGVSEISGKSLTGWDRADTRILIGGMDSAGSYGAGIATIEDDGKKWVIVNRGVDRRGRKTTDTTILVLKDANSFTWQIKDRTGGEATGDTPEVTFQRAGS
jgi:hypothetical protein